MLKKRKRTAKVSRRIRTIKKLIKEALIDRSLSQNELAEAINIDRTYFNNKGSTLRQSVDELIKVGQIKTHTDGLYKIYSLVKVQLVNKPTSPVNTSNFYEDIVPQKDITNEEVVMQDENPLDCSMDDFSSGIQELVQKLIDSKKKEMEDEMHSVISGLTEQINILQKEIDNWRLTAQQAKKNTSQRWTW